MFLKLIPSTSLIQEENGLTLHAPHFKLQCKEKSHSLLKLAEGVEEESFAEGLSDAELLHFYHLLERLKKQSLLTFSVCSAQKPLLTLVPLVSSFRFSEETSVSESSTFQLSEFCFFRIAAHQLVVETPRSAVRVILQDKEANSLLHAFIKPVSLATLWAEFPHLEQKALQECIHLLLSAKVILPCNLEGKHEEQEPVFAQWEFHDLLFHTRSRQGRHDNPYGGTFPFKGEIPSLPAVKLSNSSKIPLYSPSLDVLQSIDPSFTTVLEKRRSIREFSSTPLKAETLGEFLFRAARVKQLNLAGEYESSHRPYPGGGAMYELELYPLVRHCEGLEPGLYHYDPLNHALDQFIERNEDTDRLLNLATYSMGQTNPPHVLFVITARFQRMAWKYRSMAYAVTLKNVGTLTQTFYLVATAMDLAPCAIGGGDADLFSQITHLNYYEETSVGEFSLGVPAHE